MAPDDSISLTKSASDLRTEAMAEAVSVSAARRLRHLNEIGLALSSERDIDRLLEIILSRSRELTDADAGSLFLVQTIPGTECPEGRDLNGACIGKGESALYFCKAQNDSVAFKPTGTFTVSPSSLAGYVALTGELLCFEDVYHLPEGAPYQFNNAVDKQNGYRTKSVLVVPMKNHQGEVIGVLQLINRKARPEVLLGDVETAEQQVLPFDPQSADLAASLASQAAVALENSRLLKTLEDLFESFVMAAASAIEDRDPCTSGHSQRVTILTVGLAMAATEETDGYFQNVQFSPQQIKELRYAGLLHDFGKIGVRENIL
ncbi:MAG TPA: GAF domain-containing protein, partial [Abditibacteriaceae bacterium]